MKTLKFFSTMLVLFAMCLPLVGCQKDTEEEEPVVSDYSVEGYWTDYDEVWIFEDGLCGVSDGDWSAGGTYSNGKITITDDDYKTYNLKYSMPDNNTLVIKYSDGQTWGRYTRYEYYAYKLI